MDCSKNPQISFFDEFTIRNSPPKFIFDLFPTFNVSYTLKFQLRRSKDLLYLERPLCHLRMSNFRRVYSHGRSWAVKTPVEKYFHEKKKKQTDTRVHTFLFYILRCTSEIMRIGKYKNK